MRGKGCIELDFHGYTVEDALNTAESVISEIRMNSDVATCYFITGHGKIRSALFDMLVNTYQLDPVIPLANRGVVTVYVY